MVHFMTKDLTGLVYSIPNVIIYSVVNKGAPVYFLASWLGVTVCARAANCPPPPSPAADFKATLT